MSLANYAAGIERRYILEKNNVQRPVCSSPGPMYRFHTDEPEFQVMKKMGDTNLRKADFDLRLARLAGKDVIRPPTKKVRDLQARDPASQIKPKSMLLNYTEVVFEPWKPEASFASFPRVTYLNGHRGCNENLHGVFFNLRLNFKVVDPRKVSKYGMSERDARELIQSGYVSKLCTASDVIIIADTVPDGRAILLSLLNPDPLLRCSSNIIIEMTNRYNWNIRDSPQYHDMIRKLTKRNPKNLFWTANNPFEGPFLHAKSGQKPHVRLLRSLGAWNVVSNVTVAQPDTSEANTRNSLAIIKNAEAVNRPIVGDLLDYFCMSQLVQLPKKYGGPAGLLKYKGFIDFPYQVSVMKFYENIAFGVPQLLPTPRLLHALGKTNNHHYITTWIEKLEEVQLSITDPERFARIEAEKAAKGIARYKADEMRAKNNLTAPGNSRKEAIAPLDSSHPLERRQVRKPDPEKYHATWTELSDFYRQEFEPFVYYFDSFKELGDLINKPFAEFDFKNVRVKGPKFYATIRDESMRTWVEIFHEMGPNLGRRFIKTIKYGAAVVAFFLVIGLIVTLFVQGILMLDRIATEAQKRHIQTQLIWQECKTIAEGPFKLEDGDETLVLEKMGNKDLRQAEWLEASRKLKVLQDQKKAVPNVHDKLLNYDEVIMEPWKHKDSFSSYPRITYFNGHRGCNENFHAVVSRLRLNFAVVNPRNITRYGMRQIDAQELIDSGFISSLCSQSDIIVVADTVPDARGILLSLLNPDPSLRCSSNIIIEMTNRFDWMIGDKLEYHAMLLHLFEHPPKNLFWTANNPFEGPFMHSKVGKTPTVRLLRPLGVWDVESEPISLGGNSSTVADTHDSFVILGNPDLVNRPIVGDIIKYYCMPVKTLPKKYGGPKGLLQYKGFIEFPYQVSVMKFYENVAFGVPQLLPTPRLLRMIVKSNNHHLFSTWLDKLEQVQLFLSDPDTYRKTEALKESNQKPNPKIQPPIAKKTIKQLKPVGLDTSPSRIHRRHPFNNNNRGPHVQNNPFGRPPPPMKLDDGPYDATWSELSDFYRKEFEPFVYYFDSFKELEELINKPYEDFDYKNVRVDGPKFYSKIREESMQTWVGMFTEMGFSVHDFGGKE
ncbi:hypothetical protein HDU98_000520 [Podochytrium sp. JEL0797]|nr:hypothetical protein HDU98_000520 [Podochytrium sp. JEL0797]